jgi:hypothetical protein
VAKAETVGAELPNISAVGMKVWPFSVDGINGRVRI